MEASVFIREVNATEYTELGKKSFAMDPRTDEYISAEVDGERRHYQILAVHHDTAGGAVEVYAVSSSPMWKVGKGRAIGFSHPE